MEFIGSRFEQKEMLGQVCELRDACNAELARKSLSDSSGNHKLLREEEKDSPVRRFRGLQR